MPVRNAVICKAILDSGAALADAANGLQSFSTAVGANILEGTVADTPEGEKWVQDFIEFREETIKRLDRLREKAKSFCMTQPIA
jgi:hypothetical protein